MEFKNTFAISLYVNLPQKPKYLYEDEKICVKRLKLYKLLKEAGQKYDLYQFNRVEYLVKEIASRELLDFLLLLDKDKVESLCSDIGQLCISESVFLEKYEDDETGHFLLALVCSSREELKCLFINLETQWFQLKFDLNIPEDSLTEFLKYHQIRIPEALEQEILDIKNELSCFYDLNFETLTPIVFKMPFSEAPNLLINRNVLIKKGFLYFPNQYKYVSLFLQHVLASKWREKLDNLSKYWSNPDKDERMEDLVNMILPHMNKLLYYYAGQPETGTLTLETIDRQSKKLFPLCMSRLHHLLKEKSHLKHYARKQYAIFLKNAGMPYEEAIELFEGEMTKRISEERFRKQRYFYYFSHFYGQVGGMVNYLPQSCEDIIHNAPGGHQEHGCPFAHSSEVDLSDTLVDNNVNKQTVSEILEKTRRKQHQEACCLYFSDKVGATLDYVACPNSYFSCALEHQDSNILDIEDIFVS